MGALFTRVMDETGDGTGNINQAVDGSITPVVFKLRPRGNDNQLDIRKVFITIVDDGSWDTDGYGSLGALTNGLQIGTFDKDTDELMWDLLDGYTIVSNGGWGSVCDRSLLQEYGNRDFTLQNEIIFIQPFVVSPQRYFGVRIQDNLAGITAQTFYCHGVVT